MWERWDSNPLHGCLTRAGQVVQATIAPLAPIRYIWKSVQFTQNQSRAYFFFGFFSSFFFFFIFADGTKKENRSARKKFLQFRHPQGVSPHVLLPLRFYQFFTFFFLRPFSQKRKRNYFFATFIFIVFIFRDSFYKTSLWAKITNFRATRGRPMGEEGNGEGGSKGKKNKKKNVRPNISAKMRVFCPRTGGFLMKKVGTMGRQLTRRQRRWRQQRNSLPLTTAAIFIIFSSSFSTEFGPPVSALSILVISPALFYIFPLLGGFFSHEAKKKKFDFEKLFI